MYAMFNETVSVGDTDISLHICILPWGDSPKGKNSKSYKCQDLPKFEFSGGVYSPNVKTQNTQSAKICLNLNFQGMGGGVGGKWGPNPRIG